MIQPTPQAQDQSETLSVQCIIRETVKCSAHFLIVQIKTKTKPLIETYLGIVQRFPKHTVRPTYQKLLQLIKSN